MEVRPPPQRLGAPWRSESDGRLLELHRTQHLHAAPFATSLHFWGHALRAFLEAHGRSELFEALAANCLCEAVAGAEVGAALAVAAPHAEAPLRLGGGDLWRAGYRMIDQGVMVSWVAESDREFVASFRADRSWLETAQPLVFD